MGRAACTSSSSMAKRTPSAEEAQLWRQAMRDARPLRRPKAAAKPAPSQPAPAASPPPKSKPPPPPPAPPQKPPDLSLDRIAGVDKRLAERLKRGQLEIEGMLDLHGLTQ